MFAREKRNKWFKRGEEFEMLLHNDMEGTGTAFTEEELKQMQERYTIPISINALSAICEQYQAFLTSSVPAIGLIPVGKTSKHFAYVWREIIKYSLYINKFQSRVQPQAIKDCITVGHGIVIIGPSNFFNMNEFNCVIRSLPWRYFFPDPTSIEPDYQDGERHFIAWPMPRSKAKKIWNLTKEQLEHATNVIEGDTSRFVDSAGVDGQGNKQVWVIECYEKVKARIYILPDGTRTFEKPETLSYVDENGQYKNVESYEDVFIRRVIKLGNYIADDKILPITKYPFGVYSFTHNRSPYTYGLVHGIADLQHAINKFIALTMENAQKTNNSKIIAAAGTIQDKAKWESDSSRPGVVLEFEPNAALPDGGRPHVETGQAYNSAWFMLLREMVKFMEYVTGIFDVLQGNSENAPQTAQATNSIQNFGTQRPKMKARSFDDGNQTLLETLIEYMQAYSPQENIMRYIENGEAYNEIISDVKVRIEQQNGQTNVVEDPAGQETATFIKLATEDKVRAILGTTKEGRYRVHYQSSTNLPNVRQMVSQVMQSIIASVADDNLKILLTRAILELQDFPEIDKVLRDADVVQRLQSMVEQLQAKLEEQEKQISGLQNQVISAERQARLSEWDAEADKVKNKLDAELSKVKDRVKEYNKSENKIPEYS